MKPPIPIVKQIALGPMMNFVYLIACGRTRQAAAVDPAWEVPRILQAAEESGFTIGKILLTHSHPDHMNGLERLLEATDAQVYLHADEEPYMHRVGEHFQMKLDFVNRRRGNFHLTVDGEEIPLGDTSVKVLHTPGHTPGSQCFLAGNSLISGDTLFVGACGRVDLPGSDPAKMWWSLNRKLKALPDETVLYPGHNYGERPSSTLGEEKRYNPFMRYETVDRFLQVMGAF